MKNEQVEQLIKIALAVHQVPDENQEPSPSACAIARSLIKLQKLAAGLHNRGENQCNYAWANEPAYLQKTTRLEQQAEAIAKQLGARKLEHQRNPSGAPLKITIGEGEYAIW